MQRRHFIARGLAFGTIGTTAPTLAAGSGDPIGTALAPLLRSGALPGFTGALRQGEREVLAAGGHRELGGEPVEVDTPFRIASLTKPLTAVAAMTLVEDGRIALDDPVDPHLPELADMQVLRDPAGPLDDTVPAERPITLRHLLTQTFGLGAIMTWPAETPLQQAMAERGLAPGLAPWAGTNDAYLATLARLPLAAQPGAEFHYNTGLDLAGILVSRLAGRPLGEVMRQRIFDPLGMSATGFVLGPEQVGQLARLYLPSDDNGQLAPAEGAWLDYGNPDRFQSGAGGLASTAPDYLRFQRMMLGRGALEGTRILSEASVAEMTRDHLSEAQRTGAHAAPILGAGTSWGLGMAVALGGGPFGLGRGAFRWNGGYGTTAYVDPARGLAGVLMTGVAMSSPQPPERFTRFWRTANEWAA